MNIDEYGREVLKLKEVEIYEMSENEIYTLVDEFVDLILKRSTQLTIDNLDFKEKIIELKRTITLRKE